jgi:hypothetical protein
MLRQRGVVWQEQDKRPSPALTNREKELTVAIDDTHTEIVKVRGY